MVPTAEEKNFDEFITSLKDRLNSMSEKEKNIFFAKPAKNGSFEGQTTGQHLYAMISNDVENHDEIKDRLCEVVGSKYIDKYMTSLEELRKVKQDQIMELTEHLYHFSQNSHLSELEPRFQHSCTLNEEAGKSLCFATKERISPYIGKPASNDPNEYKGISVFMDEPCLVLSGIDLKKYAVDTEKNKSYRYEVDKKSFKPLVSLSGDFTHEYASEQTAKITNVSGPFGLQDIYQANIPIYYIPNAEDRHGLKTTWQQHMNEGMSRHKAMETTQQENPDKMYCLNKDKKLQQQMQSAIQIERVKSKITNKNHNNIKENKTGTIDELRGLASKTNAPYKYPSISQENLKALRYYLDNNARK